MNNNIFLIGFMGAGKSTIARTLMKTYNLRLIEMDEQIFGPTTEAFGTIYGDGKIRMFQPTNYVSYYSSCEQFVYQYMTLYVMNKDQQSIYGTVGTFINVLKWISDDEAEKLMREGY